MFVDRATADEALRVLRDYSTPPASMVIQRKWPAFEKNMKAVIAKSPELRKLTDEYTQQEKRYEATRKLKFNGKLIVVD